ncbi:MAG: hypothetical protein GF372_00395 [Candidatus Marinimicrobia bacterium]|nr:hypothetical protein [Candidatus Neomarinimicrobiota bacterium]
MEKLLKISWVFILPFLLFTAALAIQADNDFSFSHQQHNEMGIGDCSTCHAAATESTIGTDDLLPDAETCAMCHGEDVTPPTNYPRITDYQTVFSHELHAVDEEIDCSNSSCHAGVLEDSLTTVEHLPTMTDCYTCHESEVVMVPADCYMCHTSEERLLPKTHTSTWNNYHGLKVSTGTEDCASCHVSESFCQDCHFGDNVVQQSHPVNWELTHGLEARQRASDCTTCHESKQFCSDCHAENLVMPITHAVPGWATQATGGMHASKAMMDIDNCASCHTDPGNDPVCLECHSR